MITPTGVTVADYWSAIKAGNPTHARMTFTNSIVLDGNDIESGGLQIQDILNGDTDLMFGKAVMKSLTCNILLSSKLDNFVWNREFLLEMGVEINGTTNWVNVGYFSGTKPENIPLEGVVNFTATDRMKRFDVLIDDYLNSLTFPITFESLYHGLCTFCGVGYDAGDELANIMSRTFDADHLPLSGATGRDLLAMMAEACGCYARINSAGNCQMVWFSDQTSYSVTGNEEFEISAMNVAKGYTWAELEQFTWERMEQFTWEDLEGWQSLMKISALSVKSSDDDIGVTVPDSAGSSYVYYIINNPFLYNNTDSDVENYIRPIYNRLSAFGGYLPMNIGCKGNWLVESGDIITVDFNGQSMRLPIFARTMEWNGAINDVYESTGRLQHDVNPASSTHQKYEQMGRFHEIRQDIDGNYEKIQNQFGEYYTKLETASYVSLQLSDYYGHVSGITIDANGVEVTGSKYVKIRSGGSFYVDANNFKIDSSTGIIQTGDWLLSGDKVAFTKEVATGIYTDFTISNGYQHDAGSYSCGMSYQYIYSGGVMNDPSIYFYGYNPTNQQYTIVSMQFNRNNQETVFSPIGSEKKLSIYANYIYPWSATAMIGANGDEWKYGYFKDIYGTLHNPSSREMKHDIVYIGDPGKQIDRLSPVRFVYNDDEDERIHYGLIWEDTVNVLPNICSETDKDDPKTRAINYVELVPILLKEIQNLRKRVKELEHKSK